VRAEGKLYEIYYITQLGRWMKRLRRIKGLWIYGNPKFIYNINAFLDQIKNIYGLDYSTRILERQLPILGLR